MSNKKAAGEIYHIYNRGVDKRNIFMDDDDHLRFIHDLFEFNDEESVLNLGYFFLRAPKSHRNQSIDVGRQYIDFRKVGEQRGPRKLLVEILAFCLMPNHYHLILKPRKNEGLSEFIKKLDGGYAKYFNHKYERVGTLFQSRYKSVVIKDDSHFIHLPFYIHANPLDLAMPEWRERQIDDYKKAINFLENYRWSSFLDYTGKKNFPSVTQRKTLLEFFGGEKEYRKQFTQWLKEMDGREIDEVVLE